MGASFGMCFGNTQHPFGTADCAANTKLTVEDVRNPFKAGAELA